MTVNASKGTQFFISYPTTSWIQVAQITELDGPDGEMGTREITTLDSAAKEFAASLFDGGTISGKGFYDPTLDGHKTFSGLILNPSTIALSNGGLTGAVGGAVPMKMVLPTTTKVCYMTAVPTKWTPGGFTPEGSQTMDFAAKISGPIIFPTT